MEKLDFNEVLTGELNEQALVIKGSESFYYKVVKRGLDILFSLALLIVTSPILIISLMIVFLQDFKNPLFSQKRVGVGNKEFTIYKIRSMVHDAEKNGAKWAEKNDMRVTTFGKFIRKTRIDELPQLWNVIKGEMSLIGPRPELEVFYKEFEKTIPNFRDRLQVRPGLGGWAQVNGGYDITPKEKLEYDLEYIENLSFKLEAEIFFKTIKVVLTGDGAR